jgi:hypothetical protein
MTIFYKKYRSLQAELREEIYDIDRRLQCATPDQKIELHLRKASIDDGLASLEHQLVLWREEEERLQQIFKRIQLELTSKGPMNLARYRQRVLAEPGLEEAYNIHLVKTPKL